MPDSFPVIGEIYRQTVSGFLCIPTDWAEDAGFDRGSRRGTLVIYHTVDDPAKNLAVPLSEWNSTIRSGKREFPRFFKEPLTDALVEELWYQFGSVPLYRDEDVYCPEGALLARDWFLFYEYTPYESVLAWFDANHSKGAGYLLSERKTDF